MSFGEEFSFVFGRYGIYILIAAVIAYLIGSINTSIITTRIVAHKDIRTMGSGNAGFTNVLRTVGKGPAIVTFIGDFLKGVVSILIAYLILIGFNDEKMNLVRQYAFYISGLACVLGHMYPIFYGFKGGKGVVTTASVMLMTDWRTLVAALVVFAIMFATTKVISKCALVNASVYPITTFCFRYFLDYMPNPSNSLVFVFFATFILSLIHI